MSFANLSPGVFLAGLAALAAGLFLLQRLRVRHQRKMVVTTLFWKEALEEARARVLVKRFRHPWAYLLVLLICALLWLGFAEPRLAPDTDHDYVVLIDGSAGMQSGQRFARGLELLEERLSSFPADQRSVIWCGSSPTTVLRRGESDRLLAKRLETRSPENCPSTVERVVRELTTGVKSETPLSLLIVGDAPLRPEFLALLPKGVDVRRLAPAGNAERPGNSGITDLGVTPAASGTWDRVDALVTVRGAAAGKARLSVSVDGRASDVQAQRETVGGSERIILKDLPARGEILHVSLMGNDAWPADDAASIVLPRRPLIRVALSPALHDQLRAVLVADPAVVLTSDQPDVVVRRAGESLGGEVPALEVVPAENQKEAFLLHHERSLESSAVLLDAFNRLGIEQIDAMELARSSGRVIEIGAAPASQRGISIWDELLSDSYNFTGSSSFPLFVALTLRWLTNADIINAYAAVGEPVMDSAGPWSDATGTRLDPVGVDFTPPTAGEYQNEAGQKLAASLLDPLMTLGVADDSLTRDDDTNGSGGGIDLASALAGIVLIILLCEWFLHRTGRVP